MSWGASVTGSCKVVLASESPLDLPSRPISSTGLSVGGRPGKGLYMGDKWLSFFIAFFLH